jgi:uncharacterized membrane-anchored protein
MPRSRPGASRLYAVVFLFALAVLPAGAQQPEPMSLDWQHGPTKAKIGNNVAEIDVPEGYMFVGAKDTQRLLESWENPIAGNELATIAPVAETEQWVIIFTFDDVGYVSDEEKSSLDPDALLSSLREGNEHGNELRAKKGWEPLTLVGWQLEPQYDAKTNNLNWATVLESKSNGQSINHNIRILGRKGVMSAELLCSPEEYSAALPKVGAVLQGYGFIQGNRYQDYIAGTDKVAEYGLAALITGGAVAVAAKSGLLGKFWKLIVVGVVALVAAARKLFRRNTPENS